MTNTAEQNARVVYLSHGGGPLPILGDPGHEAMVDFMRGLPELTGEPEAILVVSAHWEEQHPTLLAAERPPMLYDYYGFPPQAYEISYPAPGAPGLANRIAGLLEENGFAPEIDAERGYDHGLFIPLKLMYPDAQIPSLQLSLVRGLDASVHVAIGRALQPLMSENILIVGSGFSFHNLRAFSFGGGIKHDPDNDRFQEWLIDVCTSDYDQPSCEQRLIDWETAPGARYCHPREEHLLPLHVCAAMAQGSAKVVFDDAILGKRSVAFLW